jgi:hypothetical protein
MKKAFFWQTLRSPSDNNQLGLFAPNEASCTQSRPEVRQANLRRLPRTQLCCKSGVSSVHFFQAQVTRSYRKYLFELLILNCCLAFEFLLLVNSYILPVFNNQSHSSKA